MGAEKSLKKLNESKSKKKAIDAIKLKKKSNHKVLHKPMKSPACKSCPALKKGICKCARKRLK